MSNGNGKRERGDENYYERNNEKDKETRKKKYREN